MVVIKMWSAWPQRQPSPGRRLHWFSQPRAICWPCRRWDRGSARPPSKSACSSSVRKPPNITRLANHKTPLSTVSSRWLTRTDLAPIIQHRQYMCLLFTLLWIRFLPFFFPFGLFAVAPFFCSAIAPNCPPFICFFFIDLCAPAQVMVLFNLWFEIRRENWKERIQRIVILKCGKDHISKTNDPAPFVFLLCFYYWDPFSFFSLLFPLTLDLKH